MKRLKRRWLLSVAWIMVLMGLAGSAFATLELPDLFDVDVEGLGPVVASFEAITNEVGYVVDETFDGEITFKWTMKWTTLEGGSALHSWSLFNLFDDNNGEPTVLDNALTGVGTVWPNTEIGTFREPGSYIIGRTSGTVIQAGVEYDFTLVVDYHAGERDTAIISGGGFINQPLSPGDWSFHHIRARCGSNAGTTRVDFTNMSITSTGIGGVEGVDPVDPPFPADWHAIPVKEGSRKPRVRIRQLEEERDRLLAKLSVLPKHDQIFLSSHLGYHSLFEESDFAASSPPHQIDFKFNWSPVLDSIALAPAFNPKESGAYAFPKRFKIEVLDNRTDKFEEVVNWMEEDFPDPGPYPVFFSGINRAVRQVRITIPPGMQESGVAYFAIGEVFLFQQALDGQLGDNMAVWGSPALEVEASGSFTMPTLWDLHYLYDGSVGFGFPLSDQTVESKDLMVIYDDEASFSDKVQITLDLGRQEGIGQIDFWPAGAPYLLALPSLGFPSEISLELSPDPDFKTVKELKVASADGHMCRENLFFVMGGSYIARYIRITMKGLSEYKGKKILGLGEISVSEYGQVLSANCTVTAQGIPEEHMDQLPRLVDGYCRQRLILQEGEWIKGLAQRRPLDRRLGVVEEELELARVLWAHIQWRSSVWGGGIIFSLLVCWIVLQRWIRKRCIAKIKWRIANDLHDDVGSSLGSVSLAVEQLKRADVNAEVKTSLHDLSLLTREAWASLREVVWVISENEIGLYVLIQKLVERAQRVLGGVDVCVEMPEDCPNCIVSFASKRHLIMLFKEIVHNAARHAQAKQVWLHFSIVEQNLRFLFRDNGCGFDSTAPSEGLGLESMSSRAEEMGGKLELDSRPGEGTKVVFVVPLKSLIASNHGYITSN